VEHDTLAGFARFLGTAYEKELYEYYKEKLTPENEPRSIPPLKGAEGLLSLQGGPLGSASQETLQRHSRVPPLVGATLIGEAGPHQPDTPQTETQPKPPLRLAESAAPPPQTREETAARVPPDRAAAPERAQRHESRPAYAPIAIIGVSGIFPKSPDLRAF